MIIVKKTVNNNKIKDTVIDKAINYNFQKEMINLNKRIT